MLEHELRRDESERLQVYDDKTGKAIGPGTVVEGHPTIGVGRALDRKGISKGESNYLLYGDMLDVQAQAKNLPWYSGLSNERKAVILCMLFQLGLEGTLGFHKMIAAIQASDWATAAAEMRDSPWHQQTPARCERLALQMATGVFQP